MAGAARKVAGWLWAGAFYALVLAASIALVVGGTLLATFALAVLRNDASWHLIAGIPLMLAGIVVFVGGVILLFRITDIPVPGRRFANNTGTSTTEYTGYTDASVGPTGGYWHNHGGSGEHDGGGGGSN
jgi:hypothetical protein